MKEKNNIIAGHGHLSDETIALYAEAMIDQERLRDISEADLKHVDSCPQCKLEIIELYEIIKDDDRIRETIDEKIREKTYLLPEKKSRRILRSINKKRVYWISSVAAIIVILIAVAAYYFISSPLTNEQIFKEYFTPYQNVVTVKGKNNDLLSKSMLYYDIQQYDLAIKNIRSVLVKNPGNQDATFYLGNCYLAQGKASLAKQKFIVLSSDTASKYYSPATWYLAMAVLLDNDMESAQQLFLQIKSSGNFYAVQAAKILEEIN